MASIYNINKGINNPIEFKGLKAQYIGYLGIGLVILLVLFAAMYIVGINLLVCILIISAAGTTLFMTVYKFSYKYGEYGLLKKAAKRYIPTYLRFSSRKLFVQLNPNSDQERRNDGKAN